MPVINGTAGDDTLTGGALNDVINGLGANDSLSGGGDNDKLDGGAGNDSLLGGTHNDTLFGGAGNDRLQGDAGDDTMTGGTGNDSYLISDSGDTVVELAAGGYDAVFTELNNLSLADYDNVESLIILGFANLNASGSDRSDELVGSLGNNQLFGGKGNDYLYGRAGVDTLIGGVGNDTYRVDAGEDIVLEILGQGKDTVIAEASYTLAVGQEIEVLTLDGTDKIDGTGNEFANIINGNEARNVLTGGDGNDALNGAGGTDILNGGKGNDVMAGGKGDDLYFVDSATDKVTELVGQGTDAVISALVNYALGANVEHLVLSGLGVNGTGNTLNNTIEGNELGNKLDGSSGNDSLNGAGGNDTLLGGAGNDTLNSGWGADIMIGGTGTDVYIVESTLDVVTEAAGGGIDRVNTTVDGYALGANVENLTLLSVAHLTATGNELGNSITGNTGNNNLDGGKGNDTLDGGKGDDALYGNDGKDSLLGGEGLDYMVGGIGNDTLKGGAEIDYLEGGIGADVLYGDAEMDGYAYRIGVLGDLATLGGDKIHGFQTGVDKIELVDLIWDFGIDPANAISGGYVLLTKVGDDTLVRFDKDGAGAAGPVTLATVVDTAVAATDLLLDSSF